MTLYVFTDLDDTLFQTRGKCPADAALHTAAVDRQGQPLSFATEAQQHLLAWLEHGVVVPVTGRNSAALARVRLSFPSFRITSHGAMVLGPEGSPDAHWLATLETTLRSWQSRLTEVLEKLEEHRQRHGLQLRCRIIEDQGLPCYLSVKGEAAALADMASVVGELWEPSLIHRNGENMALLPAFASKARAVTFVLERLAQAGIRPLSIGIGDSLTDMAFMQRCDYAMIPRRSQIQERLWP